MSELNRRKFLIQTSLGASALGLLGEAPSALAATEMHENLAAAPLAPNTTMMLHVRDAASGEVALFIDHGEIVFRDPRLVARLISAARKT